MNGQRTKPVVSNTGSGRKLLSGAIFAACCLYILSTSMVLAGDPPRDFPVEPIPLRFPVQFTRNDGQWDTGERYRILHQASEVALRQDGLDLRYPDNLPRLFMPIERSPHIDNTARLRFVNPSSSMSIEGVKRTETVSHFYPDNVPKGGIEHVPNFSEVIYTNVWDGIDIGYRTKGECLVQSITLHPGADASRVRFVCDEGMLADIAQPYKIRVTKGKLGDSEWKVQGNSMALPYIPGILRDTIVLETEFSTFFGKDDGNKNLKETVLPDGTIMLLGLGKPPVQVGPTYFTSFDTSGPYGHPPLFVAGFACDGRTLLFCTEFVSADNLGTVGDDWDIQKDDDLGVFLYTIGSIRYDSTIFQGAFVPVLSNSLDTFGLKGLYSYLGRISASGILSVGTVVQGIAIYDLSRTPDAGVMLTCHRAVTGFYPGPFEFQPFRHYTRTPVHEYYPILMKLNDACDSVLQCVNLEVFGDTVTIVSTAQDKDGDVVLVGVSNRTPITRNAWQSDRAGKFDIYLARLNESWDSIRWSTFIGGNDMEYLIGSRHLHQDNPSIGEHPFMYPRLNTNDILAIDQSGGIWIVGATQSDDLIEYPSIPNPVGEHAGAMFVARFDRDGNLSMIRRFGDRVYWKNYPAGIEILPCGNALVSVGSANGEYPLRNALPVDLDKVSWSSHGVSAIASFDSSGNLLFSSFYGELPTTSFRYDPTGHIVTNAGEVEAYWSLSEQKQMRTYNAFQPVYSGIEGAGNAILNRQYLPLCGEDAVSCSFSIPDTIRRDSTRNYLSVKEFPLDVTITNPDPTRPVFDLSCELRLPPGLVVVPDTAPLSLDVVPMLAPGASADLHWTVHVRPEVIRDSLLPITVVTHYRWADLLDNCLYSHGGCRAEIVYLRRDSKYLELECDLEAPDSVTLDASGEWYTTDRIPVTMRLRNVGLDPVLPGEAVLHVGAPGVWIEPAGDSLRALGELRPGGQLMASWQLQLERRGYDRDIEIAATLRDARGPLPAICHAVVHVPGIPALRCVLSAPERIVGSGQAGFPPFTVNLLLENRIDTLVRRVEAEIDLSSAPHLRLPAGTAERQLLGPVANGAMRTWSWPMEVSPQAPDTSRQWITVWYWYQEDTTRRRCEVTIDLLRLGDGYNCFIDGPTAVVASDTLLQPSPVVLDYQLYNSGIQPVTVDRYELDLQPGIGLQAIDNTIQPGGSIAAGGVMLHSWRLRPLARPGPSRETVRIRALGAGDILLSECTHSIDIEGIPGLRCMLTLPDTVRFERDSLRYLPDPVVVTMELSNVLDVAETAVEATLDLSLVPRLRLAQGEARRKTLAVIDSHGRGSFTWLLVPQGGTATERQIIRVQYASATPGPWKQCEMETVLSAWPAIAEVRCVTGGHDSLFADAAYELIVPEPFQVSYTATNSGTVTLTGCRAAIVLPPGFALVGSDSIQYFGANAINSLAPGESATRWWTLETTDQLQGFGAKDITWWWSSDQQGSGTRCTHVVQVIPDPSSGITLTPLRLYFEAELGGALPAPQQVMLWTGGGLSMPWTAQTGAWYMDIDHIAGDHAGSIAVRPNTTMLNKGLHVSTLTLGGSAVNLPKNIAVEYVITSLTEVNEQPSARSLSLGPVYPHPIPLAGEAHLLVRNPQGQSLRVTLHDLLGRERALLREGMTTDSDILYLRPASLGLSPGSYLLRVLSPEGQQSRMLTVVR